MLLSAKPNVLSEQIARRKWACAQLEGLQAPAPYVYVGTSLQRKQTNIPDLMIWETFLDF